MLSNSSWVPDEDPQTFIAEGCWLQGMVVSAIAYGITVSLCILSFHILVRKKSRTELRKRLPLLIYIAISFLLGTLYIVSTAGFTQMAFIDGRNYTGGPNGFENTFFSIPLNNLGNVAFILSNWLSDALVVWRFKVIYQPMHRLPIWTIMLFPYLMFAGSVVLGILLLSQLSTTGPYQTSGGINFILPYLSLSLSLNITLTIGIVLRLLIFRYRIVAMMGPRYGMHYTSVVAVIVESAALYSAIGITFAVLFRIGSPVSAVFMQSLSQLQTIASLFIVIRVAKGKAWTGDTASFVVITGRPELLELGSMEFAMPQLGAEASSEERLGSCDDTIEGTGPPQLV